MIPHSVPVHARLLWQSSTFSGDNNQVMLYNFIRNEVIRIKHISVIQKLEHYHKIKDKLSEVSRNSYERTFELEYTHNSTAIEGNTLTLLETKAILDEEEQIDKYLSMTIKG